jgi:diguanylate cyclase (GGDEF)-like protein
MTRQVAAEQGLARTLDDVRAHLQCLDMPRAFQAARAARDAASTTREKIATCFWLARCHYVAGEVDIAITLAAEAVDAATTEQDIGWRARAHALEARCLEAAGETEAALDVALVAWNELERAGGPGDECLPARQAVAMALAVIQLRLGDFASAMTWCERGADLAGYLPDDGALGAAVDTRACIHAALASKAREAGDPVEAERCERLAIADSLRAVDLARRLGHVDYETSALLNLAESLTWVGEPGQALELLEDWARRHPDALARQWAHQRDSLGTVLLALQRPDEAVVAFEQSLSQAESPAYRVVVIEHLSTALERCERWQEALARYKEFHALQARVSAERAQRHARVAAARLDIGRERAKARQLATSNRRLRRRADDLARQAQEDALTGLANRRQVDSLLETWPQPLSLALIDVDHFKQVNDRFSHGVGDEVLKQLASIMRANCRQRELAARLGGEEFVVIVESVDEADIGRVAERLRVAVERFDWPSLCAGLRVTVSIGVARSSEVAVGTDLLVVADRRLYAAKRTGRNRVMLEG